MPLQDFKLALVQMQVRGGDWDRNVRHAVELIAEAAGACQALSEAARNHAVRVCAGLTRSLCLMGADLILSPCSWAVPADHDNSLEPYGALWRDAYVPVAREFSCAIFGVSNVGWISAGPWAGRQCIGSSLGIDSAGNEVLRGPHGVDAECIIYVDIKAPALAGLPA